MVSTPDSWKGALRGAAGDRGDLGDGPETIRQGQPSTPHARARPPSWCVYLHVKANESVSYAPPNTRKTRARFLAALFFMLNNRCPPNHALQARQGQDRVGDLVPSMPRPGRLGLGKPPSVLLALSLFSMTPPYCGRLRYAGAAFVPAAYTHGRAATGRWGPCGGRPARAFGTVRPSSRGGRRMEVTASSLGIVLAPSFSSCRFSWCCL
jgi:hypothetical protein